MKSQNLFVPISLLALIAALLFAASCSGITCFEKVSGKFQRYRLHKCGH